MSNFQLSASSDNFVLLYLQSSTSKYSAVYIVINATVQNAVFIC